MDLNINGDIKKYLKQIKQINNNKQHILREFQDNLSEQNLRFSCALIYHRDIFFNLFGNYV